VDGSGKAKTADESSSAGFFQKILSVFFQGLDPEREKRRLLRDIGKDLKKKKHKFYKPANHEAQPALARFFYEIYKVIGPAQVFLEHAQSSNVLKNLIIEFSIPDEISKYKEELEEDVIRQKAEAMDNKKLSGEVRENLVNFFAGFKGDLVKQIDETYNLLSGFLQFIHFDYYFFLKKFDSNLPERDFNYNPKFEAINAQYISDDLKDFLEVLPLIKKEGDWDNLLDILKGYKNTEILSRAAWKKVIRNLDSVRKEMVFEQMVRHIDSDPYYKAIYYPPNERIVEEYLNKIKTQTEMVFQKIQNERQNQKLDKLLKIVFGTTAISRMRFYTEKENLKFSKKMLGGFIYIKPLNYIKAFLLDYFKRDIKSLIDLLLIRGRWSTNLMSQQLSESFYSLMEVSDELLEFDESLSEEGSRGPRIRQYITRSEKDKNAMVSLRKVLKEVNDEALSIIQVSAQNLITIGKSLKQVLDDYEKRPHELLTNWKEIEQHADKDIHAGITDIYKRIYYFIQLLQYYVKKSG